MLFPFSVRVLPAACFVFLCVSCTSGSTEMQVDDSSDKPSTDTGSAGASGAGGQRTMSGGTAGVVGSGGVGGNVVVKDPVGTGGTGGTGGSGGAMAVADAGVTPDKPDAGVPMTGSDSAVAASITKIQFLAPCTGNMRRGMCFYDHLASAGNVVGAVDPGYSPTLPKSPGLVKTLGGDPNATYEISLHVRGVFDVFPYAGGTRAVGDGSKPGMYVGGAPVETHREGSLYAIKVAEPAMTYWLNEAKVADPDGEAFILAVTTGDYVAKIKAKGGTQIEFIHVNYDNNVAYNAGNLKVGGVDVVEPYVGVFVQVDAVDTKRL
jgi:hypothetical protein